MSVDADTIAQATRGKEWDIGARLTADQRDLVTTAATSGRQLELVLGVAGAGKTTALDALRAAYQAQGLRVLGTATSGQAAKTLGAAAHLPSRTTASLLWRLQHGDEHLDASTVLIVDEAGMLDDPTMLALLTTAEIHQAKVIVVGDHHQLGAVGPGGGLEGLVTRHPDAVHTLSDNVRQRDPAERAALEALRDGVVGRAVSFYATEGRIRPKEDRLGALIDTVMAWAGDVDDGHDTVMLAWRRNDVAALNHLARTNRRAQGLLGDTSVDAPGGRRYSVGDQVVALAPDPQRRWVTSQRGTVTASDKRTSTITVAFDHEQEPVALTGEQLDAQRLDHAYATTVHRAQGATVDRAHVYLDGGGRELTYAALSRARDTTTIHCVADNLDQAVEDLHRDWSHGRRQRWTLDTDLPAAPGQATRPSLLPSVDTGLRLGRLRAERTAILAAMPADPGPELAGLAGRRRQLEQHLEELHAGTGRYQGTDTGQAASALRDIEAQADAAQRAANSPTPSRRQQRKHARLADDLHADLETARQGWNHLVRPIEQQLGDQIDTLDQQAEQLGTTRHQRAFWRLEHPPPSTVSPPSTTRSPASNTTPTSPPRRPRRPPTPPPRREPPGLAR